MKPESVPADLVEKACQARWEGMDSRFTGYNGEVARTWRELVNLFPNEAENRRANERISLAAVLPAHQQSVTAKYRRFVRRVRAYTIHGESLQTPAREGGAGDECVLSPGELREALRELRDGRK